MTDVGQAAVSALPLMAVDQQNGRKFPAITDDRGGFRLELPAGTYKLHAREEEEALQPLVGEITLGADEELHIEIAVNTGSPYKPQQAPGENSSPGDSAQLQSLAAIRDYESSILEMKPAAGGDRRALGDIVNVFSVRKKGWLHGSVYWFHRNDNFDARNFFDPVGHKLPEFKRNQFGVTLGAPLGSRVDLLGTYEGLRIIQGSSLVSRVPSPDFKGGDFSALEIQLRDPFTGQPLPGNRIPDEKIHPVSRRLLALYPLPNRNDSDRNFINSQPLIRNRDSLSLRGDYRPDRKSKVVVSYELGDGDNVNVTPLPAFGHSRLEKEQSLVLNYSRNLTSRLVLDGQARLNRKVNSTLSINAGKTGLLSSLGIAGISARDKNDEGYPVFDLNGYANLGDERSPDTSTSNWVTLNGLASYARGAHNFKAGAVVEISQLNNIRSGSLFRGRFSFNGYYSGDAFADFLYGLPDTATRARGSDRADLRGGRYEFFVQDSWKISPRYTVTGILAYNFFRHFRSIHENVSIFHPLLFEPPTDGEIVVTGSARSRELGLGRAGRGGMVFPDRNDWAPRLGLAYSPFGNNRLVFRTSYNISYAPLRPEEYARALGRNFPFYTVESAQSPVSTPLLNLSNPFTATIPAEIVITAIDPQLRTTYQQAWHLTIETEIWKNWNIKTAYIGGKATRRSRTLPANVPLPGPGSLQLRRPNPAFGRFNIITGSGSNSMHSLELHLERRFARGFSVKSAFVWNRTLSDVFRGNPSNPRNLQAERSASDFVKPRRFSLHYIYDLPFGKGRAFGAGLQGWLQTLIGGWRISGITEIEDEEPMSVTVSGDYNNDGVSGDRADRLGAGALPKSQRSIDQWFAIADFAKPAPYSFGNAGRSILQGPGVHVWDINLIKRTAVADGKILELRIELFNAFNHANFNRPNTSLGSSQFGKIYGADRAREMEIAIKYTF